MRHLSGTCGIIELVGKFMSCEQNSVIGFLMRIVTVIFVSLVVVSLIGTTCIIAHCYVCALFAKCALHCLGYRRACALIAA